MPDNDANKRQAYAVFLEGTAERLHSLLQKKTVEPDELSGDIERHLISALEIVSGTPVEFVDNNHQIGYRFIRSDERQSTSQPKPTGAALDELADYPIWKAVQKNLTEPEPKENTDHNLSIEKNTALLWNI